MIYGFADTPEHQADAHAGAEQHRIPGCGGELWLGVTATDADLTELAECEIEVSQYEEVRYEDQELARGVGNARHGAFEEGAGVLLKHQCQQDEDDQHKGRQECDVRMDVEPETGPVGIAWPTAARIVFERCRGCNLQPLEGFTIANRLAPGLGSTCLIFLARSRFARASSSTG